MWDLYGLDSLLSSNNYKEVGRTLGDIFKYIFQVEFGQNFLALFKVENTLSVDPQKVITCGIKIYEVVQKLEPVIAKLIDHPETILSFITTLPGYFKELEASCSGVFDAEKLQKLVMNNLNSLLFVTSENTSLKSSGPSISDVVACVKSISPLVKDIYSAIVSFKSGDTEGALKQLEQAAIDGVTCGMTCYKVIKDI